MPSVSYTSEWTLEYVPVGTSIGSGTEMRLADWGFQNPMLKYTSQGKTVFSVDVPEQDIISSVIPAVGPNIPFEGYVVLRRNRAGSGVSPVTSWSGGSIVFQGRNMPPKGNASAQKAGHTLDFGDAWYDLENLVFQQFWNIFPNGPSGPIVKSYFSRVNLFQAYSQPTAISAAVNINSYQIQITLAAAMQLNVGDIVSAPLLPGCAAQAWPVASIDGTHTIVVVGSNTVVNNFPASPAQLSGPYTGPPSQPQATLWADGQFQTNGEQIAEIIRYAAGLAEFAPPTQLANGDVVRLQPGTIDLNWQLPIYPVRAASCASCLEMCLKPTPDAVHWIDYSTTPPKFNCRQRQNLDKLQLPFGPVAGSPLSPPYHSSSDITPRFDLVPSQVVLQYERTDNINSTPLESFFDDVAPPNANGKLVRAMVVAIDLRGAQGSYASVQLTTAPIPQLLVGPQIVPDYSWWKQKRPALANADIGQLAIVPGSLTVTDDNGNSYPAWATQLPNELTKGEIDPWMTSLAVRNVTIAADFSYNQSSPDGVVIARITDAKPHRIHVRVKICNAPAGQSTYQTVSSFQSGEIAPPGLANNIYTALSVLPYEGSHKIIDPTFDTTGTIPTPQYVLNLIGGNAAWATMNATIQTVTLDIMHQTATINFGPPKHIQAADLEELLQFYRFRTVYDNPQLRISGQGSLGKSQTGGENSKENTEHANPNESVKTFLADGDDFPDPNNPANLVPTQNFVQHDAVNGKVVLSTVFSDPGVPDILGTPTPDAPVITVAQSDAFSKVGNMPQNMKIQEWDVCTDNGDGTTTKQKALFLSSLPYNPSNVVGQKVGTQALTAGTATGAVSFATPLSFTPFCVFLCVTKLGASSLVLFAGYDSDSLSSSGFNYNLSGAPDGPGYFLNFLILSS